MLRASHITSLARRAASPHSAAAAAWSAAGRGPSSLIFASARTSVSATRTGCVAVTTDGLFERNPVIWKGPRRLFATSSGGNNSGGSGSNNSGNSGNSDNGNSRVVSNSPQSETANSSSSPTNSDNKAAETSAASARATRARSKPSASAASANIDAEIWASAAWQPSTSRKTGASSSSANNSKLGAASRSPGSVKVSADTPSSSNMSGNASAGDGSSGIAGGPSGGNGGSKDGTDRPPSPTGQADASTKTEESGVDWHQTPLALSVTRPLFPNMQAPMSLSQAPHIRAAIHAAAAAQNTATPNVALFLRSATVTKNPSIGQMFMSKDARRQMQAGGAAGANANDASQTPIVELVTNLDQVHRFGVLARVQEVSDTKFQHYYILTILGRIWAKDLLPYSPDGASTQESACPKEESQQQQKQQKKATSVEGIAQISPNAQSMQNTDTAADANDVVVPLFHGVIPIHFETERYNPQISRLGRAYFAELVKTVKELSDISPRLTEIIQRNYALFPGAFEYRDHAIAADMISAFLTELNVLVYRSPEVAIQWGRPVVESIVVEERLRLTLLWARHELSRASANAALVKEVEDGFSKRQRENLWMEQRRALDKLLGEKSGKDAKIDLLKKKVLARGGVWPLEAKKTFDHELKRLANMEQNTSEFQITFTYLENISDIPWGKRCPEIYDPIRVREVLTDDHYGLDDVKDRIQEFVAVGKLRGGVQGKILCLVGPPGVGKTSVGKSIARALKRPLYRISVGGLQDVSEIKGHRRTYVGAMPGKIIQALKRTGVENPVILIDEIDKISDRVTMHGNPASALLELLDPEQNSNFVDHYLDVPVDLSNVLFICTANDTQPISPPLLDRMEVINVSGYILEEKMAIAERYLIPQALQSTGLVHTKKASESDEAGKVVADASVDKKVANHGRATSAEEDELNKRDLPSSVYSQDGSESTDPASASQAASSSSSSSSSSSPPTSAQALDSLMIGKTGKGDNDDRSSAASATTTASSEQQPASAEVALPEVRVSLTTEALRYLIEQYCRESGVRSLKRHVEKICRKIAFNHVSGKMQPAEVKVDVTDLQAFVGSPKYLSDSLFQERTAPPGVVVGLAYTSLGGATLFVESTLDEALLPESKPNFSKTGSLGDVMSESARISYTLAKSFIARNFPQNRFFRFASMHLHVPEGAVAKEGPSAGVTMTTALISLALDQPVVPNLAMTGEVTLSGRVLRVGGIREKVTAAKRENITRIALPAGNKADWEELPKSVQQGVTPIFCTTYDDVFRVAFEDRNPQPKGAWWWTAQKPPSASSAAETAERSEYDAALTVAGAAIGQAVNINGNNNSSSISSNGGPSGNVGVDNELYPTIPEAPLGPSEAERLDH